MLGSHCSLMRTGDGRRRFEHTRAAILKGGSYCQPQGSIWYFPQAYKLTEHGKYLLIAPSKDQAGTLGFRCAVDSP